MQRTGRKGHAQFRVVAQDKRYSPKSGRVVAHLGNYDPHTKAANLDKDKITEYLKNGAQPSPRVVWLLTKEGVKLPSWVAKPLEKKRAIKNVEKLRKNRPVEEVAEPKADETPAEAPAEVEKTEDKPAVEVPTEEPKPEAPAEEAKSDDTPAEPAQEEPSEPEEKAPEA